MIREGLATKNDPLALSSNNLRMVFETAIKIAPRPHFFSWQEEIKRARIVGSSRRKSFESSLSVTAAAETIAKNSYVPFLAPRPVARPQHAE
jgi:hypothetical protein